MDLLYGEHESQCNVHVRPMLKKGHRMWKVTDAFHILIYQNLQIFVFLKFSYSI